MLIDVTVKIPEERVGDFHEIVGRWLSGEQPGASTMSCGNGNAPEEGAANDTAAVHALPIANNIVGPPRQLQAHAGISSVRR
jgi:hypothetical protein